MKISCIINVDTRPQKDEIGGLFSGTVNSDFLNAGVLNKKLFFTGFDIETIVYVDCHSQVDAQTFENLQNIADCVVVRRHTDETSFNDYNYIRALSMASGDIVCHMDQDTACFTSGKEYVEELISGLGNHKFISYPSHWSPRAVTDESFGKRTWASTRFFLCKRESLQLDILRKCIEEPEWAYQTYGDSPRRCNWLEHFLSLVNEDSVYYPPVELHKGAIFSWSKYTKGTLESLNNIPYEQVKQWILHRGGVNYPCDIRCE